MALSVAPVNNPTFLGVQAPTGVPTIGGVITATPGSNGFATLAHPAAASATTDGTGGTGGTTTGGTTSTGTLSPAEINAALAQLVAQQQTEQNQYDAAKTSNAGSDAQQAANEQLDVQNNTGARANAIQNAEQAAASGNQGLKAVLASLGALGGTGQILAGRAVADSANNNIGSADSTYTTNAQKIAEANDAYLTAKGQRDQALDTALQTDKQSTANSIYQDIINKAENIGDTATANTYLGKLAGSETPITPINAAQVLYQGANTAAYAPSSSVNVTSAPTQAGTAASQSAAQNAVTPVNSALYVNKTT